MPLYTRPSFPFYPDRYMGGTTLMSAAARGAYVSMLCVAWNSGPIPNTQAAVMRAMSLSQSDPPFADLWAEIMPKWVLVDGVWINEALERVRTEAEANALVNSKKGLAGAKKRWEGKRPAAPMSDLMAAPIAGASSLPSSGHHDAAASSASRMAAPIAGAMPQPSEIAETMPRPSNGHQKTWPENSSLSLSLEDQDQNLHTPREREVGSDQAAVERPKPSHPRNALPASIIQSPKAHMAHAWCHATVHCVPKFLHDDELAKMVGGEADMRDRRLKAIYEAVAAAHDPNQPITMTAVDYWRSMVRAHLKAAEPAPRPSTSAMGLAPAVADQALDALLDRAEGHCPGLSNYTRSMWFGKVARLEGDTLAVRDETAVDWIDRHYREAIELAFGGPVRIVAREAVPA